MVAIKNFLLFAVGAAALILPRDAAQIQADLKNINGNVTALNTAITNYNGGVLAAIPIQTASDNLNTAIKSSTTDAQKSTTATSTQSKSIISYISKTLEPNIAKTINNLISKKSQLAADGLTSNVQNNLNTTQTNTDAFSKALVVKASSDQKSNAQTAANKIHADIQKGITAFKS